MLEQSCVGFTRHNREAAKPALNSEQYDGETAMTAISQNFFVRWFETGLFSKTAAE
jgi:hypothetical protein